MEEANNLAYYDTSTITTVKSFMEKVRERERRKKFMKFVQKHFDIFSLFFVSKVSRT